MHCEIIGQKPLLLVFPFDVMAHYLRCIELSYYFKPWFNVRFLYSRRYDRFVSEAGFETFRCAALDADKVQQCLSAFDFSWLNERELSHIYQQQVKVIEELKPAAVLGDTIPTLRMATEKTGVYYLSLMNGYMSKYYAYVRRMPRSYPLYRLFNLLPTTLYSYFTNVGEHIYFHDIHRPFKRVRRRNSLAHKYSYLQEIEGDLNLICDLSELFPQKQLPENYFFVPPLFHALNNRDDICIDMIDTNKKTLFVSMGSTGDWKKVEFLNKSEFQKYNIITAGDEDKIIHGANVVSYSFINSAKLFEVVDVVICHGGNGTCYQALSCGIPVLGITSNFEQDYNIDGLERQELGRCLNEIEEHNYLQIIERTVELKHTKKMQLIKEKIVDARNNLKEGISGIVERSLNMYHTFKT